MRSNLVLVSALILPAICFAGIETVLVGEQQGNCTVRVVHDATPSSEIGTIDVVKLFDTPQLSGMLRFE